MQRHKTTKEAFFIIIYRKFHFHSNQLIKNSPCIQWWRDFSIRSAWTKIWRLLLKNWKEKWNIDTEINILFSLRTELHRKALKWVTYSFKKWPTFCKLLIMRIGTELNESQLHNDRIKYWCSSLEKDFDVNTPSIFRLPSGNSRSVPECRERTSLKGKKAEKISWPEFLRFQVVLPDSIITITQQCRIVNWNWNSTTPHLEP